MKLSIRSLILISAVIALASGWWYDRVHWELERERLTVNRTKFLTRYSDAIAVLNSSNVVSELAHDHSFHEKSNFESELRAKLINSVIDLFKYRREIEEIHNSFNIGQESYLWLKEPLERLECKTLADFYTIGRESNLHSRWRESYPEIFDQTSPAFTEFEEFLNEFYSNHTIEVDPHYPIFDFPDSG
jgi:hypothetical protein